VPTASTVKLLLDNAISSPGISSPDSIAHLLILGSNQCDQTKIDLRSVGSSDFQVAAALGETAVDLTGNEMRQYLRYLDTGAPSAQAAAENSVTGAQELWRSMLREINAVRRSQHLVPLR
jgi:hypothetical protein